MNGDLFLFEPTLFRIVYHDILELPMTITQYQHKLNQKIVGAGAVLLNATHEIMILKPTYKDGWGLPGGAVENNESPLEGVIREIKEEIGLDIKEFDLMGIEYDHQQGERPENIQFTFFGGVLTDDQIHSIDLATHENSEFRFVATEVAVQLLRPYVARRLPFVLEAIKRGRFLYLENGNLIANP